MPQKIIQTLLILTGPVIMALTQTWGIILPEGLGDTITAFLNVLLLLLGGTATVVFGVPALVKLAPRKLAQALKDL